MDASNSGLAHGTSGSPQTTIENKEAEQKSAENEARIKAELEAKRKAEEEARIKAELEAKRKAEEEARIKAEKEAEEKAKREAVYKEKIKNKNKKHNITKRYNKTRLFNENGSVTLRSISANRHLFYNKTRADIVKILNKNGYETKCRGSVNYGSAAEIIIITNPNKNRNIMQVQVSLKSRRHQISYIKISTNNIGIFKIVNGTKKQYKSEGYEKAKIFFKRNKKKRKGR